MNGKEIVWGADMLDRIETKIGMCQIIGQAAEEAAELSAALSKYRRKIEMENPTPKSNSDCYDSVLEEMADLEVALRAAGLYFEIPRVKSFEVGKIERWYKRVFGEECGKDE